MEASEIVYNYIEFFFSKDELKSMMTIKPFSYDSWLDSIYELYSKKPLPQDNKFHYNIMHTKEFETINKNIKEIEKLSKLPNKDKNKIDELFKDIEKQYSNLYYYEETYVYAHYIFNNIRKNIIESFTQIGGGHITLEEFKQKIRDKINDII
jgi:hypothetical protein